MGKRIDWVARKNGEEERAEKMEGKVRSRGKSTASTATTDTHRTALNGIGVGATLYVSGHPQLEAHITKSYACRDLYNKHNRVVHGRVQSMYLLGKPLPSLSPDVEPMSLRKVL
jgi:hypothetical protein